MAASFHNQVVLVTGGNSGIGLAAVRLFHAQGARVAFTGRNAERVKQTRAELGPGSLGLAGDFSTPAAIDSLVDQLRRHFGSVNSVFANAGISGRMLLGSIAEQDFDEITRVNFKSTLFLIQAVLPLLSPAASIVVNTSINNRIGQPGASVYAAGKAALRSLVRNFAVELAPRGIRINAVSPGLIETEVRGRIGIGDDEMRAARERLVPSIPLGRMGTTDEIARAVLFLASSDASYITGAELVVDGGLTQT